jgi:hypothetical protein
MTWPLQDSPAAPSQFHQTARVLSYTLLKPDEAEHYATLAWSK